MSATRAACVWVARGWRGAACARGRGISGTIRGLTSMSEGEVERRLHEKLGVVAKKFPDFFKKQPDGTYEFTVSSSDKNNPEAKQAEKELLEIIEIMDDGLQEEVYEADGEGEKGESTEETKAIFDDFTFVANEEAKMCGEDVEERAFHDSVNSPINNINLQQNWDSESGEKLQVPEHQTVKKEIERKGRKMGKGSRRQAQRSTSSDEKN